MRTPHAFHIDGVSFRILDRDGRPPEAHEPGLKDAVFGPIPARDVGLIMAFPDFGHPDHPCMYHCHILEHEDAGVMGQFQMTA
jgi:FtsP/CotA-like multicopper oxidase with cupredoxin domain